MTLRRSVETLTEEHPALACVRLPFCEYYADPGYTTGMAVQGLLASCPALRVLDFTAFGFEDNEMWPTILKNIKGNVQRDVNGAGRLTHVFACRNIRTDLSDYHDFVVNLLEEDD